jgi:signal transduction histidine kinase
VLNTRDNGKGITRRQISDPKSLGLIGIRERVHFFGGKVKISGIQNKGTTVTVSIPINKS